MSPAAVPPRSSLAKGDDAREGEVAERRGSEVGMSERGLRTDEHGVQVDEAVGVGLERRGRGVALGLIA